MHLLISFIKKLLFVPYEELKTVILKFPEKERHYIIKILLSVNKRSDFYIGDFKLSVKLTIFLFENCSETTNRHINLEYIYYIYNSLLDLKLNRFIVNHLASDFSFNDVIDLFNILKLEWRYTPNMDNEIANLLSLDIKFIENESSIIIGSDKYLNIFYLDGFSDKPFTIKNPKLRNTIRKYINTNYTFCTNKTKLLYNIKSLYFIVGKNNTHLKVLYKQDIITELIK